MVIQTHLTQEQEYSFSLHAQGYEMFFLHGTSQSAGVLLVVRRNTGIIVKQFLPVSPHLGVLDILIACWHAMHPHTLKREGVSFNSLLLK